MKKLKKHGSIKVFEGFAGYGQNVGKRHGYSTKNFVLGAIDYFCEKNGY